MEMHLTKHLEWGSFALLDDARIAHAVTFREGGVSQGPYHALNISYDVGDEKSYVDINRKKVQELLRYSHLREGRQTHGKKVVRVSSHSQENCPDTDALITDEPGVALFVKHADCQAALFYDPLRQAVGAAHAGWRGNILNIYAETIHAMQKEFGTNPHDLLAAISPSLGPDHAEFIQYEKEWPPEFWEFRVDDTHFDLWKIAEHQLIQAGLLPHHIEIARLNTFSDPQRFFSYRREKRTGRHGSYIVLRGDT